MYLKRVQQQRQAEERVISEALLRAKGLQPNGMPIGQRLLGEDERSDMLKALESQRDTLQKQHQRLPLSMNTVAQKQRARKLEQDLHDVEKNMDLLGRPRILVSS
eukprot:TRINITY_DN21548_c0_g1_i2.p4 TRINITY_DN21548_c0_g1~~TRINITY_DN21548_c0_g1_i2.p4  ORF type:complete len:105 (-),score=31.39 TRINITY_DN21548_c0_g1_i2:80-394(-)